MAPFHLLWSRMSSLDEAENEHFSWKGRNQWAFSDFLRDMQSCTPNPHSVHHCQGNKNQAVTALIRSSSHHERWIKMKHRSCVRFGCLRVCLWFKHKRLLFFWVSSADVLAAFTKAVSTCWPCHSTSRDKPTLILISHFKDLEAQADRAGSTPAIHYIQIKEIPVCDGTFYDTC